MGFLFGALFDPGAVDPTAHAAAFAVVGMAAFFTAVVRAPLTGIILVTEMTDNSRLLLPMLFLGDGRGYNASRAADL